MSKAATFDIRTEDVTFDIRTEDVTLPVGDPPSADVTNRALESRADGLFKTPAHESSADGLFKTPAHESSADGLLATICSSAGATDLEGQQEFLASYTCCPPPIFIPVITLTQIIVFIVYVVDMAGRGLQTDVSQGFPHYSPLYYKASKRQEVWRFLTYMLIHNGYGHILSNVIMQLLFGLPMEMVHGWWRVGVIYLTGVLAGSLACSVMDHETSVVGASGGCFAIVGAHIGAVIINWREMHHKVLDDSEQNILHKAIRVLFSPFVRLSIAGTIVALETGRAIFVRYQGGTASDNVTFVAHIGGLLAGLFLGIRLLKNVHVLLWESVLGVVTLVASLLLFAFAVLFNVFFKGFPSSDWT